MPRKKLELSNFLPYHVVCRANNREWFSLPADKCWETFCDYLFLVKMQFDVRFHSFVLMSNHFHLELSTPQGNLPLVMNRLMSEFANSVNFQSGRINHVFGGQYKATIIKSALYSMACHKYILTNPVRAKICELPQLYPYSSLAGQLGMSHLPVPIESNVLRHNVLSDEYLSWLMKPYEESLLTGIKKALKRREFKFANRSVKDSWRI